MDDECQAAEILTSIMTSNSNVGRYDEPNIIQSDSMDGHVDPVSCQLMQVEEFDEDDMIDTQEDRDETSGEGLHRWEGRTNYFHQQSPPAPRSMAPTEQVRRPQPYRLQLFPMPSASYSYDDE